MRRRPRLLLAALIGMLALVAAACGGDDGLDAASTDDGSGTEADEPSDDGDDGDGDQGDEAEVPDGVRLLCDVNPPEEVDLGSSTDGEIVDSDDPGDYTHCYVVEVPEGTGQVTLELTGLSGNLGLNVAYPDLDALRYLTEGYWSGPHNPGTADEVVVIEAPEAGSYFIGVGPGEYRDLSTYTLTVSDS